MLVGCLTVTKGLRAGKRFLLKDLTVFEGGRTEGHHIFLKDPSVARSHFRVYRNGDEYTIHDLGTSKGTLINGDRVEKGLLGQGDKVLVGEVELEFEMVDETTSTEEPVIATPAAADPTPPTAVEKVPALVIIDGKDKGRTFLLSGKERFKVGRALTADLKLTDGKISREHCLLETVRDHHIIIDLESSNGTVVNGERIKKTVLKEGDYIRLGFTLIKYDRV
jgi:pSer/pThr/pTyr-binding forkhead associated (FHA) protein